MTQVKQAEHSLWQRDVETPGSGGHRFMTWVGTTVQQHGNSHIPSFFPATWTVCARLSHPPLPAVGLPQMRVLHFPLTPSAAAPFIQRGKHLPGVFTRLVHPSSPEIFVQPPRGIVGQETWRFSAQSCRGAELCMEGGKAAKAWKTSKLISPVNQHLLFYQHIKCN